MENGGSGTAGTAALRAPQVSAEVCEELRRMGLAPQSVGLPPAPPPNPAQRVQPGPGTSTHAPSLAEPAAPRQHATQAPSAASRRVGAAPSAASIAGTMPQNVRRGSRAGLRGLVNLGSAGRSMAQARLVERAQAHVGRPRRVAFLSFKGGVGKTTVTALTGLSLSAVRRGSVAALDADPDRGTLVRRLDDVQAPSVRDFLWRMYQSPQADPRLATHTTQGGLHVLDSARSPVLVDAPTPKELWWAVRTLERSCPVVLLDCGTSLSHPVTEAMLKTVDAVVVVTTPAEDSVAACVSTLGWLERNGYERLAKDAAVAVTDVRKSRFDRAQHAQVQLELGEKARTVLDFGFDPGLVRGGVVALDRLSMRTRETALEAAAFTVSGHQS
ncbi:MAG: MinD/ParA family ATP-binding protein [Streptosporangiales bacterium]